MRATAGDDHVCHEAARRIGFSGCGFGEKDDEVGIRDEGSKARGRELGGDVGSEIGGRGFGASQREDLGGKGREGRGIGGGGVTDCGVQGFRVSKFESESKGKRQVSKFQSFKVSRFQGFKVESKAQATARASNRDG